MNATASKLLAMTAFGAVLGALIAAARAVGNLGLDARLPATDPQAFHVVASAEHARFRVHPLQDGTLLGVAQWGQRRALYRIDDLGLAPIPGAFAGVRVTTDADHEPASAELIGDGLEAGHLWAYFPVCTAGPAGDCAWSAEIFAWSGSRFVPKATVAGSFEYLGAQAARGALLTLEDDDPARAFAGPQHWRVLDGRPPELDDPPKDARCDRVAVLGDGTIACADRGLLRWGGSPRLLRWPPGARAAIRESLPRIGLQFAGWPVGVKLLAVDRSGELYANFEVSSGWSVLSWAKSTVWAHFDGTRWSELALPEDVSLAHAALTGDLWGYVDTPQFENDTQIVGLFHRSGHVDRSFLPGTFRAPVIWVDSTGGAWATASTPSGTTVLLREKPPVAPPLNLDALVAAETERDF
jgi:hypothetical protein